MTEEKEITLKSLVGIIQREMQKYSHGAFEFNILANNFKPHWNPFHRYEDPKDNAKAEARTYIRSQRNIFGGKRDDMGNGGQIIYNYIDGLVDNGLSGDPKLIAGAGIIIGELASKYFIATVGAESDDDPKVKAQRLLSEKDKVINSVLRFYGKNDATYEKRLFEVLQGFVRENYPSGLLETNPKQLKG